MNAITKSDLGIDAMPPVTILLSTFNGAAYLREQLDSFCAQSYKNWRILWRDDGSSDTTVAIMRDFAAEIGPARCLETPGSGPHYGAAPSFLHLLAAAKDHPAIAFADQDDVWLPEKLARAVTHITGAGDVPALYCARQFLVDESLRGHKLSIAHINPPGFPASLTQNIANGNTLVMNRAAAGLVTAMPGPEGTVHDWWSYIVVSACGGRIIFDAQPQVLYRLHKNNLIASSPSTSARAISAMQRGSAIFMTMMRRHANTLAAHAGQMTPVARTDLALVQAGLKGSLRSRLSALRCPRFTRRTALENILFRYWFITG